MPKLSSTLVYGATRMCVAGMAMRRKGIHGGVGGPAGDEARAVGRTGVGRTGDASEPDEEPGDGGAALLLSGVAGVAELDFDFFFGVRGMSSECVDGGKTRSRMS